LKALWFRGSKAQRHKGKTGLSLTTPLAVEPLCRCAIPTANLSISMPVADYLITLSTKIEKYL